MRCKIVCMMMLWGQLSMALDDTRDTIEQRIRPIGVVRTTETSVVSEASIASKKSENLVTKGQEIYDKYCMVCHQNGLAGAPKFRDSVAWKQRLMVAKNLDGLLASAIKGRNAMPPKGTCFECSAADLKAAIEYMVPQS